MGITRLLHFKNRRHQISQDYNGEFKILAKSYLGSKFLKLLNTHQIRQSFFRFSSPALLRSFFLPQRTFVYALVGRRRDA